MSLDHNQRAFFELLRVGLFPEGVFKGSKVELRSTPFTTDLLSSSNATRDSSCKHDSPLAALSFQLNESKLSMALAAPGVHQFKGVDWDMVYLLAQEQSVQGLVLQGLELFIEQGAINKDEIPQELLLRWIGEVQIIEQQNVAMNEFVAWLIEFLRKDNIYALLVKGQGIAQCYEKPLWRASGDVDLLLCEGNYERAKKVLLPLATDVETEYSHFKHQGMTINGWIVELHGTQHSRLSARVDRVVDEVQGEVFYGGKVRTWMNGQTQVFLPALDEDAIYLFYHILQHFFFEGIGLRQICDWCRLLWTYKDSLNQKLLESRIKSMGVMTEWKAFAALAVDYLGMPAEAMPFYSDDKKWKRKAVRVMEFVLETGNFGHNRDYSYQKKYPYIIYKVISFWKHLKDGAFFFTIFPLDSIKVTWRRMVVGVSVVLQGKKHE